MNAIAIKKWMTVKSLSAASMTKILGITPKQTNEMLIEGVEDPRRIRNIEWLMSNDKVEISDELKQLMVSYGLNQKELALVLGMLPDRLERILAGQLVTPDIARYVYLLLNSKRNFDRVAKRDFP